MDLKTSQALKAFKKEAGQINHMLITLYVGLDGIISHNLSLNPSLHTSWNPESKEASVDRSRIFVRKATIAWLVDCIDMYLKLINQAPLLLLPSEIKNIFDGEEYSRSVHKRVKYINSHFGLIVAETAFIDLLICWRNKMVHYDADNNITSDNRQLLLDNKCSISKDFCGLDIVAVLEHFDENIVPTFKEVTSLVRATINYIYQLDGILINQLDLKSYADRIIIHYLREGKPKEKENTNPRINNVFSKGDSAKLRTIKQILKQNGFFESESTNEVDEFCAMIAQLDYRTVSEYLKNGSFLTQ